MNAIASIVLIGWIPVVVLLFAALPPGRATVVAFVVAWLFLPNGGFSLPGLPDYTKAMAASVGVLLGGLISAPGPILAIRPRWVDLPMAAWCLCPFASSIANGLGPYDGLAEVVSKTITYGLPYLAGRVYLGDPDGARVIASGIIMGGLAYIPLCLWEIRMSPQLHRIFYGMTTFSFDQSIRYGGYRPTVFMVHGLEVGMWMATASLLGCWLWYGGIIRRVGGKPFGAFMAALLVTTILCKSTGAIVLLVFGLTVLWGSRRLGSVLPALLLASIAPLYCGARTTGLWNARNLVTLSASAFGEDRAGSLDFRLYNEDILMARALQSPVFGWGGWGRARVYNEEGKDISVTDGLWIIALGNHGILGLGSLIAVLILPSLLLCRSIPARRWDDPAAAPAAALALFLALYMIDNISNAMFNPIFYLAVGALLAPSAFQHRDDPSGDLGSADPDGGLEASRLSAERLEEQAVLGHGDWAEAERAWRALIALLQDGMNPSPGDLASAWGGLGRCLKRLGRWSEAIEVGTRTEELLVAAAAASPDDDEITSALSDARNDLAWSLAIHQGPEPRETHLAIRYAEQAVAASPARAMYWNTLGATYYRAGDIDSAIRALERSVELSPGGTGFDHVLLAMAHSRRGEYEQARLWLIRADEWICHSGGGLTDLVRLRNEVATEPGPPYR